MPSQQGSFLYMDRWMLKTCCPGHVMSVTSPTCTALSPVLPGRPYSRYPQECCSLIQEALPGHGMAGSVSPWKKACTKTETNSLWLVSLNHSQQCWWSQASRTAKGTLGTRLNVCSQLCAGHSQNVPGPTDTRGNLPSTISH